MREAVRRHPLATFVGLTYAISWACWVPFVLNGDIVRQGDPWPTHMIGLLGPALAAIVVTASVDGGEGVRDLLRRIVSWRVPLVWYGVSAATLGVGLAVAAAAHDGPFWTDAASYTGTPNLGLALTFLLVLVDNGFGEETGWRGFLADRLLRRHGVVGTALLVFVVWGVWHLPLFFLVESFRGLGLTLIGWAIGLACGSLVLTWMYARAEHCILVVALWHTSFNFASGTALMEGVPAAVTSTAVMLTAGLIVAGARVSRRFHVDSAPLHPGVQMRARPPRRQREVPMTPASLPAPVTTRLAMRGHESGSTTPRARPQP